MLVNSIFPIFLVVIFQITANESVYATLKQAPVPWGVALGFRRFGALLFRPETSLVTNGRLLCWNLEIIFKLNSQPNGV